ncbi:AAA family ATPase [Paenibacillus spongiae]|uniref:AAA family ATPase n=1 Tax=Paenibacillus spongiae TaxID=2909671 RepID=A0ABY5SFI7_9BACL|nr:AAA family ATPase [Paenibacillus spongiae]UVI32741.1 AAA family ATPase [Paenibacillus spongiae]
MKIVIEGPSAVGKTKLCRSIEAEFAAYTVQETIVEPIPGCSPAEEAIHYLNQEVHRWQISEEMERKHPLVLLDTDPFKSLWFNKAFGYMNCMGLQELDIFFGPLVAAGELRFPDLYILLDADEHELQRRKEQDSHRERHEFEWVSLANEMRRRYYRQINHLLPGSVWFIHAIDADATVREVCRRIPILKPGKLSYDNYASMIRWLAVHN